MQSFFFSRARERRAISIEQQQLQETRGGCEHLPLANPHTHHPTQRLLSQHDSPLPPLAAPQRLNSSNTLSIICSVESCLSKFPKTRAFLCFHSVQAISRTVFCFENGSFSWPLLLHHWCIQCSSSKVIVIWRWLSLPSHIWKHEIYKINLQTETVMLAVLSCRWGWVTGYWSLPLCFLFAYFRWNSQLICPTLFSSWF